MKLRVGTRQSRLAMTQTKLVCDIIKKHFPELEIELVAMNTLGDRMLNRSLDSFGGRGVFTQELDRALLDHEIDLAVHSAKDMPLALPDGLYLGAAVGREDPGDVLVTVSGIPLSELPEGSVVGTSSLRRSLQLLRLNPRVRVEPLRGNVPTRLEKLRLGEYDAIVLAAAGLRRLELAQPEGLCVEYLDLERFLPACGQGILAVETRAGELTEIMTAVNEPAAMLALTAEREYLSLLGGSCNAPCAAWCREEGGKLVMSAMFAADGMHPVYRKDFVVLGEAGGKEAAFELAGRLAEQVRTPRPVMLAGAGSGDMGLVTQRCLDCVRQADVVVYDHLAPPSLLNEAPLDAELIYAGKQAGRHAMPQEQINALLVERAAQGARVVRLKGGDPFVFGRGGEEALALKHAGLEFEIVPGVTSACAVPAYAGIPVTHRGLASSFHVITGHERAGKEEDAIDYKTLAREEGTLIFLMGLARLERIAGRLLAAGKAGDTPAAVISQGTTGKQWQVVSDLAHIAETVREAGLKPPAITVVGAAAALSEELLWFARKPLSGVRVLATGTRHMAEELTTAFAPLGAEVIAVSLVESRLLRTQALYEALDHLGDYQWLAFTSANGVELFFALLRERRTDIRSLMHMKFAAVGSRTAAALRAHGFCCDFMPHEFTGAQLAAEWAPTLKPDERVLLLRAREGSPALPEGLRAAGVDFTELALYETWADTRRKEELCRLLREVDYVALCSVSAARAFTRLAGDGEKCEIRGDSEVRGDGMGCGNSRDSEGAGGSTAAVRFAAIGPSTAREAGKLGLTIAVTAEEYTADGLAAAILADVTA